jgi:ABC-type transport system involved in multi-copper enzyme maturation permease subunit
MGNRESGIQTEKNKRRSPFGGIAPIFLFFPVLIIATLLETALLREWAIAVPRGTLQGTATVIIGSIIVFAVSMAVICFLSAYYIKRYRGTKEAFEGENNSRPKKTGIFRIEMKEEYCLPWSYGLGIITEILIQLMLDDYFISIPHGTHESGMIAAIGSLIIMAGVFLIALSITLLVNYFSRKNGRQVSI